MTRAGASAIPLYSTTANHEGSIDYRSRGAFPRSFKGFAMLDTPALSAILPCGEMPSPSGAPGLSGQRRATWGRSLGDEDRDRTANRGRGSRAHLRVAGRAAWIRGRGRLLADRDRRRRNAVDPREERTATGVRGAVEAESTARTLRRVARVRDHLAFLRAEPTPSGIESSRKARSRHRLRFLW
jgi:hypothetical protein